MSGRGIAVWIPYACAAVVNLGGLIIDAPAVAATAQVLLMPALALVVIRSGVRTWATKWLLVAIVGSWLGDSLPKVVPGEWSFIAMVAGFLIAQIAFILAFLPRWRDSIMRRRRRALIPYLAVVITLVALCAPAAGPLLVPLLVYAVALLAMSVLATAFGTLGTIGGAMFLLSDSLIAITSFTHWTFPGQSPIIMFTYITGQALIALAVLRRERARR